MKHTYISFLLALVLVTSLVGGCANQNATSSGTPKNPAGVTDSSKQDNLSAPAGQKEEKCKIYVLPKDGGERLALTTETLRFLPEKKALALGEAWLKANATNLPAKVQILKLEIKNKTAQVSFNKEFFQKGQGEYTQTMLLYSLVNTLTELPEVTKVELYKAGVKAEALDQIDLGEALTRNKDYLPK